MNDFFVNILVACLFSLPGSAILLLFKKKFDVLLSNFDIIILGALLWNFILVVPSIFIGIYSNYINLYFEIFTVASSFFLLPLIFYVIFNAVKNNLPQFLERFSRFDYLLLIFSVSLFPFLALITWLHPVYIEYDALFFYLVASKNIVLTNSLSVNLLKSPLSTVRPPAMPIVYAWGSQFSQSEAFRLIPFVFFLLTAIMVYLISKELFPKRREVGLAAVGIFSMSPAIIITLSQYSLYLDMGILFYTSCTIFCTLKAVRYNEKIWFVFMGIATSMSFLTKESGILSYLISLLILLLYSSSKLQKIILSLLIVSPFIFFSINDLIFLSPELAIPRLAPLVILWLIVYFLSLKMPSYVKRRLDIKPFIFILISLIGLVWYLRNYVIYNIVALGLYAPSLNKVLTFLTGTSSLPRISIFEQIISWLRFDTLIASVALGSMFVVPKIAGLWKVSMDIRRNADSPNERELKIFFILMFVVSILWWCFFYKTYFQGSDVRYVLQLGFFLSIFAAIGIVSMLDLSNSNRNTKIVVLVLFSSFLFYLELTFYLQVIMIKDLVFWVEITKPYASLPIFLIAICLSLTFLLDYDRFIGVVQRAICRIKFFSKRLSNVCAISLLGILLLSIFSQTYLFVQISLPVVNSGLDSKVYSDKYLNALPTEYSSEMVQISNYFKENVHDNFTTIAYYGYPLAYFAERRVIDLTSSADMIDILPLLTSNNESEVLSGLLKSNIRYFLFPNQSSSRYADFSALAKRTILINAVIKRSIPLKSFQSFDLLMLFYQKPIDTLPFSDNFNEFERQGTNGRPIWIPVSGNWNISNQEYTSTGGFDALAVAGSSNWTNYTLEVSIKPVNYGEIYYHSPRVVFYYRDSNNYYEFALYKGDSENVVLRKVVNGTSVPLTVNSSIISEGKSYEIKVILHGLHISIYVDGVLVINFIDSSGIALGKIGLKSGGLGKHHFDNVNVYQNSS